VRYVRSIHAAGRQGEVTRHCAAARVIITAAGARCNKGDAENSEMPGRHFGSAKETVAMRAKKSQGKV
jgi:hypothetical protein